MSGERAVPRIIPILGPVPPPTPLGTGATWHHSANLREVCNACLKYTQAGYHFGTPVFSICLCPDCAEDLVAAHTTRRRLSPASRPEEQLPPDITLELSFSMADDLGIVDVSTDPEPATARQELAMIEEAAVRLYAYASDYRTAHAGITRA